METENWTVAHGGGVGEQKMGINISTVQHQQTNKTRHSNKVWSICWWSAVNKCKEHSACDEKGFVEHNNNNNKNKTEERE